MEYVALYRKYRPQTFEKVVGQTAVTKTLSNQVKAGQIGHAYLLCGTRGTGKTTTARIFARAINCLAPEKGSPCGKCSVCRELSRPGNMDIIEIDAASNNKVDDVRTLIEKVHYLPTLGKFKVYIIDEVHMLSEAAFNALLKTLEEPPAHVVFLLGTTEPQKLPQTILSRCMRFDFKLVGVPQLEQLLGGILQEQNKLFEPEALRLVAAAGEGSVRDCLSLLDRCLHFSEGKLSAADVLEMLGSTDRNSLVRITTAILTGDTATVFSAVDDVANSGKSMTMLAKDLANHFRDLLILKTCATKGNLLAVSAEWEEQLQRQAQLATEAKLLSGLRVMAELENSLKTTLSPRICVETACLKVLSGSGAVDADSLELRIRQLEKGYAISSAPLSASSSAEAGKNNIENLPAGNEWAMVLQKVRTGASMVLALTCAEISSVAMEEDSLVVRCNEKQFSLLEDPANFRMLSETVSLVCQKRLKLERLAEAALSDRERIADVQRVLGAKNVVIK